MIRIITAVMENAEETNFDKNQVTPGVEGFIFTGLLAAAIIVLGFLLVSRLRRNAYRHEIQDQIAEELEGAAGTPGASDGPGSARAGIVENETADGADGAAGGAARN